MIFGKKNSEINMKKYEYTLGGLNIKVFYTHRYFLYFWKKILYAHITILTKNFNEGFIQ